MAGEGVEFVQVRLLFFAKSRELTSCKEDRISLPCTLSFSTLLSSLLDKFNSLSVIAENIILALNQEYLEKHNDTIRLREGDEIAVIPPISGGEYLYLLLKRMDHIKVTEDKLSVEEVTSLVTSPTSGAISLFMGTTRDNFGGKTVIHLAYEAYVPMAESEMRKICHQIRDQWPVENIALYHRIGEVPVSEGSVIIAVSSPHRKESLEAVHYAIDTLKATVPIWKKEFYEDDTYSWKENCECTWTK